ncbi:MAG: molybdate ABC transporter substrate-binding protein [Lentisphaeria bacterium]|nr:molybdate ABC transporter substrate-binding protein [Lentisphaeria bacterium]
MKSLHRVKSIATLIGVLALVLAQSCKPTRQDATAETAGEVLTLYVPCGMNLPFRAAQKAFMAQNPGVRVELVLDNANVLVRRVLEKGEKPDIIVSPGLVEMEKLQKHGAVGQSDVQPFGRYELVLFTSRANPANITTFKDLTKDEVKTIAIADPDENSVGRYTRQTLKGLGLWDSVQGKLQLTDHPITAYKYVAREKAEASFAYRSCPLKTAPEKLEYSKIRIVESVPRELYGPAYAVVAPLSSAPNRARADQFVQFLLSDAGQTLLSENDVPVLTTVEVFVPCGMLSAFLTIRRAFEEKNPGIKLKIIFDRADALTDRILKQGQKPDIHCSIGHVEKDMLVREGAIANGGSSAFGQFQLALCAHRSKADLIGSVADLAKPEVKRILLTPPENSSVGLYAKRVLEKENLWDAVESKIVYLPTIKDCYKELSANKADAVFAYIGCPVQINPEKAEYSKVKAVATIPESAYGGAVVFASVLKGSSDRKEVGMIRDFLQSPIARAAFAKIGLLPPPK